jgi:hypothetical protein
MRPWPNEDWTVEVETTAIASHRAREHLSHRVLPLDEIFCRLAQDENKKAILRAALGWAAFLSFT